MARGKMNPDTALEIALSGASFRLAGERAPITQAVTELRTLAAGRADLLGKAAGAKLGGFLGEPQTNPQHVLAAAYLIAAGADHEAVVTETDTTRSRVARSAYGS